MGHFKELRENGLYCDSNPVQVEQGSTAITTYKHKGQPWAHARHRPTQTFSWPIWRQTTRQQSKQPPTPYLETVH